MNTGEVDGPDVRDGIGPIDFALERDICLPNNMEACITHV